MMTSEFSLDSQMNNGLVIDRRCSVRSVPVVEGTALWIDDYRRVQVKVIDESDSGIGVIVPGDASFEFGPTIYIDYMGERRAATMRHLTRTDEGYRLGLSWD